MKEEEAGPGFSVIPPLDISDLKAALPDQDYEACTLGDDAVAARCLEAARMWAVGKIAQAGAAYDETDKTQRLIVIKRALYELFAFVGQETRARMKEEDAIDLIESYFCPVSAKGDAPPGPAGPAMASVVKREAPRYGG